MNTNKKSAKIVIRYIVLIIGLLFSGIGVAFTKRGDLGVSPISSTANVISIKFDFWTMGTWLIVWNCILILAQIFLLRRNFKIYQLLQIPLSFLFGWFTDFGMWLVSFIPVPNYAVRFSLLLAGIVILAFGISLSVIANVIMNSGEALVKAISDTVNKEFGHVKVVFDISCVLTAVILSLILFGGRIVGAREGTIISAIFTGLVVKFISKRIRKPLERLFVAEQ
ncbi:MAG: DUF6198 family protein [Saccharofermentans sp.]|nr:DUF6198 family protein [Saccharofermentans sp.]